MRLAASDIIALHRPSLCPLRVYLRQHGVEESEPGAFEQILETLGERHELGTSPRSALMRTSVPSR